jgi:hypothetical protein
MVAEPVPSQSPSTGPADLPRIGSDFEDFLRDESRLQEATAVAIKRVLAWEIQRAMDSAGVSQAEMARRMSNQGPL